MLEQDVVLYLPWPPTVNNYYKVSRHGQRYLHKRVKEFRDQVCEAIAEQCPDLRIDDQVFMEVYLYPPDRRKRDLDNHMKGLLDGITQSGLWEDDSQVDQLHIYRGEIVANGSVRIEIADAGPVVTS